MKIYYSLPSNEGFFNRYASLLPSLRRLSYLAQVVSLTTEIGIIYFVAYSKLSEFFSSGVEALSFFVALLLSLTLEVGLRKFVPYSIRAILWRRFSGLDLAMSFFIIVVSLALLLSSGFLSFKGSKDLVEIASPPPVALPVSSVDSTYQEQEALINTKYKRDSSSIVSRYNSQIEAKEKYFNSSISEQKNKIKRYKNRQKETGENLSSSIAYLRGKIAKLKAQRDKESSHLQEEKAQELKQIFNRVQEEEELSLSSLLSGKQEIKTRNKEASNKAENRVNRYGGFLAYFSLVCLLCFLFCITIEEINKKGSGITEKAIPTPYYFTQDLSSSLLSALSYRFNFHAREIINQIEEATPPPVIPTSPPPLFDMSGTIQQKIKVEMEEELEEKILKIGAPPSVVTVTTEQKTPERSSFLQTEEVEEQILNYLRASLQLTEAKLNTPAQEMELKANDVIKVYLGAGATNSQITGFRTQVISFIQGIGENPFHTQNRQRIGFKQNSGEQALNLSIQGETHTVEHNGKHYTMRDVKSYIRTYTKRVKEARAGGKKGVLENREAKLQYWQDKKTELLTKINA